MTQYALLRLSDQAILSASESTSFFKIPDNGGSVWHFYPWSNEAYAIVEVVRVNFNRPGVYYTQGSDTVSLDTNTLTITRAWTPWTQQEIDAYELARKDSIANQIDAVDDILRAAVLVIMDDLNLHSTRLQQILDAAATATTLANFKSGMANIQPIPQRTPAQVKTQIRSKIE